ncbi:hypothetical protein SeMB42_g07025 [Synchytrium endobioticum]|uniref:Uncharacterized protein n=1 Tax=Synchytrium endobioticum TaxID=286115 RepID=A0A507D060_9FUNG|nr:hypothetical protein SeMB42_g07025 [Synchytrium endobioticum]TPX44691.1 hypothetical protein SeLEV6574_g04342 [Synchytrium endobioticum]
MNQQSEQDALALFKEFLLYRDLTGTLEALNHDLAAKNIQNPPIKRRSDSSTLQKEQRLHDAFSNGDRAEFFKLWGELLDPQSRKSRKSLDVEFWLETYFAIYPINPNIEQAARQKRTTAKTMGDFRVFLLTEGADIAAQFSECATFFYLPHSADPLSYPAFNKVFASTWIDELKGRMLNVLQSSRKPPVPELLTLLEASKNDRPYSPRDLDLESLVDSPWTMRPPSTALPSADSPTTHPQPIKPNPRRFSSQPYTASSSISRPPETAQVDINSHFSPVQPPKSLTPAVVSNHVSAWMRTLPRVKMEKDVAPTPSSNPSYGPPPSPMEIKAEKQFSPPLATSSCGQQPSRSMSSNSIEPSSLELFEHTNESMIQAPQSIPPDQDRLNSTSGAQQPSPRQPMPTRPSSTSESQNHSSNGSSPVGHSSASVPMNHDQNQSQSDQPTQQQSAPPTQLTSSRSSQTSKKRGKSQRGRGGSKLTEPPRLKTSASFPAVNSNQNTSHNPSVPSSQSTSNSNQAAPEILSSHPSADSHESRAPNRNDDHSNKRKVHAGPSSKNCDGTIDAKRSKNDDTLLVVKVLTDRNISANCNQKETATADLWHCDERTQETSFDAPKSRSLANFKTVLCHNNGIRPERMRLWTISNRYSKAVRPELCLSTINMDISLESLRTKHFAESEIRLYLEEPDWEIARQRNLTGPLFSEDKIMIFLKYYHPHDMKLHYMGKLSVHPASKIQDVLSILCLRAQLPLRTPLNLYEHVSRNELLLLQVHKTFEEAQMRSGNIIVYQKVLTDDEVRALPCLYLASVKAFYGLDSASQPDNGMRSSKWT